MSKRNIVWLIIVLLSGIIGGWLFGFPIGLIVPVVVLAISEIVERRRRSRLKAAKPDASAG